MGMLQSNYTNLNGPNAPDPSAANAQTMNTVSTIANVIIGLLSQDYSGAVQGFIKGGMNNDSLNKQTSAAALNSATGPSTLQATDLQKQTDNTMKSTTAPSNDNSPYKYDSGKMSQYSTKPQSSSSANSGSSQ